MNYAKFLNSISLARKPSAIRVLGAIAAQAGPSMISLAAGVPNSSTFPFKEATFKMWNGDSLHFNEDKLKVALQYTTSAGVPEFLQVLLEVQEYWHGSKHHKPLNTHNLCVTMGSTDGATKSLEMLLSKDDAVLVEQPTDPHVLKALKSFGCQLFPVTSDHEGILLSDINHAFNSFKGNNNGKIKCLYINTTLPFTSLHRRREVMKLAKEKDFLILEHDPFYFITPFEHRIPSLLSLDTDGRVLRFDSLSHLFAPGLRIGIVSGDEALVKRVVLHTMVSNLHCPSINQMMVHEVLKEIKLDGFNKFCQIVAEHYEMRRKLALKAAEKHLSDYFDWELPNTGYSLHLKLHEGVEVKVLHVLEDLEKDKVYFLNGKEFYMDESKDEMLFSFGFCEEEDIEKASGGATIIGCSDTIMVLKLMSFMPPCFKSFDA